VLGLAIFLFGSLISLHIGEGQLMGPFGRSAARITYAVFGLCAYLFAAGISIIAIRLLLDRESVVKWEQVAGVLLGVTSLCSLIHLLSNGARLAGHSAGGWIGETFAELSRAIVSTPGTVLLCLIGLFLAVVVGTSLRMREAVRGLGAICKHVLRWLGRSAASAVSGFARMRDRQARPREVIAEKTAPKKPALIIPDRYEDAAPLEVAEEPREETEKTITVAAPVPTDGPTIIESEFRHRDADEIKAMEEEAEASRLGYIPLGDGDYQLPPLHLLDYDDAGRGDIDRNAMLELSTRLVQTLRNYGVSGDVTAIRPGPVVTMYEFAPAAGTRLSKIESLSDELAMVLEALRVRIVAPIPGKAVVGIEVPNRNRESVYLKEIVADKEFQRSNWRLPLALGKSIEGAPTVLDLAKMPHLLVAGTTGSGKSVSINAMVTSLLYNATPEDVRMIMVDPKMLELSAYEGIPHLLLPVVTDPKKANLALRWAVDEMERRYQLLSETQSRDIISYNRKVEKILADAGQLEMEEDDTEDDFLDEEEVIETKGKELPRKLPYIVVIIDEFADLMMQAPKDVENSVARIAQKARAAGIHLILATQRPSTNVITGLIKANFPSRIAFHVVTKVDSRVVLDQHGAEALLGAGDMLFSDTGAAPRRLHGCFIGEEEVQRIVAFLKKQGRPVYNLDILKPRESEDGDLDFDDEPADEKYDLAVRVVTETRRATISYLQRRLGVGYNKAAKMIERMEREGVVSAPDAKKIREVLVPPAP
jgi:S-DNA-T family DNA segregation ATPase FtsK/SpoIIIE